MYDVLLKQHLKLICLLISPQLSIFVFFVFYFLTYMVISILCDINYIVFTNMKRIYT